MSDEKSRGVSETRLAIIEECAKVAENTPTTLCQNGNFLSERVAKAIRALKNAAPQAVPVLASEPKGPPAVAAPFAQSAGGVGIISADPITTHEQLEAVYQQAVRGRHISEIAPVLALRNKALDALSTPSSAGTTEHRLVAKLADLHWDDQQFFWLLPDWLRAELVAALQSNAVPQGASRPGAMLDKASTQPCGTAPAWRETLEEVADALDKALGDSDLTHIEDDEELRDAAPVQWACAQINKLLQSSTDSSEGVASAPTADESRDAFIARGYWPNEVLWKVWEQACEWRGAWRPRS